ncbi:chorismate pyruvate-lyase family protein [Gracilibacillus xinjiangensis]|uniref:Chorismate pyruvate-lyase family protein n=1 Tax=Gracilibacillus xinjiangensis TaxID=1193282 RepID=A0ABV8WSP9_9BACI
MEDAHFKGNKSNLLKKLIFDVLLITDGRTTDILEHLLNEKVKVKVIQQGLLEGADEQKTGENSGVRNYIRESVLIGEKSGVVVSHNIALVYSKNVPPTLFENIANKQDGIGKAISSLGMRTYREVLDCGFVNKEEAVDLFQLPVNIQLPDSNNQIPYKKYFVYFGPSPGIQLVEYFNPNILTHRLQQETTKEHPKEKG